MADCKVFWEEAIKLLQIDYREENRSEEFTLWVSVIEFIDSKGLVITVGVPSPFFKDQLNRRGDIKRIQDKIFELSGQNIEIEFVIRPRTEQKITVNKNENIVSSIREEKNSCIPDNNSMNNKESLSKKEILTNNHHPQLRADYTFDNFVLGDNNSFAYNAAFAVSKNPGHSYNPVLIYGGVGLGKTHLMQAIGNLTWSEKKTKVIYITAEAFTNEFIQSINEKTTTKFKNKYRCADVLLIDDIHFLQNKIETQEELFHTFNALYDSFKQMVFTCDRPVSELKNLSDRLRSRFERGLNVDLAPPKYETRRAILQKKIDKLDINIPDDVIDLIAQNVVSNVRDLEAALTKILAFSELVKKDITVEIAQQLLRDTFSSPKQSNITIDTIIKVVSDYYNLSMSDIKGKKRTKNVMLPRQISLYIARELTEYSTTELGAEFGGRDHTTVMHSCQKIEELLRSDSTLVFTINTLMRNVKDYKKPL